MLVVLAADQAILLEQEVSKLIQIMTNDKDNKIWKLTISIKNLIRFASLQMIAPSIVLSTRFHYYKNYV